MGRPKGSKNKSTATKKKTRAVKVTGGVDVTSKPDEATQETPNQEVEETVDPGSDSSPSEQVASESTARGTLSAPVVGMRVRHEDGDVGEVTSIEKRGDLFALSVLWNGEDIDTGYTPVDWSELVPKLTVLDPDLGSAPTEPAPESKPVRVLPSQSRSLDVIGHEMADAQAQLDDLETEKAAIVKDYGKRIGTVGARVSQLAAEYRAAERREEIDYGEGVVKVYSNRTGELLATRPIADSERQQVLPLDHPSKPPQADDDDDADEVVEPVPAEELDLDEAEEA